MRHRVFLVASASTQARPSRAPGLRRLGEIRLRLRLRDHCELLAVCTLRWVEIVGVGERVARNATHVVHCQLVVCRTEHKFAATVTERREGQSKLEKGPPPQLGLPPGA